MKNILYTWRWIKTKNKHRFHILLPNPLRFGNKIYRICMSEVTMKKPDYIGAHITRDFQTNNRFNGIFDN